MYKAIELDSASRLRTGREFSFDVETRQLALDALLGRLNLALEDVRVDPSRTMLQVGEHVWTLVAVTPKVDAASGSQRRAGAKHKHVR